MSEYTHYTHTLGGGDNDQIPKENSRDKREFQDQDL